MNYIGMDPGKTGGIAIVSAAGDEYDAITRPATPHELVEWLRLQNVRLVVVEKVSSSPQMGVRSAFTFGWSYGEMLGICAGMGLPVEQVSPQRWQRVLGCLTGGDKNISKQRAAELFPRLRVTHRTADALLLAEYGRRLDLRQQGG